MNRAGGTQKQVVGLETVGMQFSLFDSASEATQTRLVTDFLALDATDVGSTALLDVIVEAWKLGDTALLEELVLTSDGTPEADEMIERLFTSRNRGMAARIDALAQEGRWFVAVGAGHMLGVEGIPVLLSERGFTVHRIPRSP